MQKDMKVQSSHPLPSEDAELRDILIAISVVAKRLATNLENQNMEGERQHEQNERIVRVTGRDQSVIFCGQFIHAILFCSLLLRLLS